MNPKFSPPPPPTLSYRQPEDGTVRPTYWLYSEEAGMDGPYTKREARQVLAQNPGTEYLACREGEDWQSAKARLARKKETPWGRYLMALILLAAVAYGAWRWHLMQEASGKAPKTGTAFEPSVPRVAVSAPHLVPAGR